MKFELDSYHRNVSDGDLIDDLKRVAAEISKSPTIDKYNERGRYHSCTLHRRFGGWIKSLEKAGLDVDLAENGRVACEKAWASESDKKPYDLILMDVVMPELDGQNATRQLRAHGWQGPIVASTALSTKTDFEKCLDAGCTDCITKPVFRETLLATVARHLQNADAPPVSPGA